MRLNCEKSETVYGGGGMSSSFSLASGKCGEVKMHQIVLIKDRIVNRINRNLREAAKNLFFSDVATKRGGVIRALPLRKKNYF